MKITELLENFKQLGIAPTKLRGQNFLIDKNVLDKLVTKAEIINTENILEVGPGFGALTRELVKKAKRVVAVEKDKKLFEYIESEQMEKVSVVHADILKISETQLTEYFEGQNYRVIANLPYNISSAFIRKFLELKYVPDSMILMLQREVGERILAESGQHSVLSLSVNFYAEPRILFKVKPTSFFPQPKVDSVILELKNIKPKYKVSADIFFKVVKLGFSAKRKMLVNNLKPFGLMEVKSALNGLGLSEKIRAEELTLNQWVELAKKLQKG